MPFKRQKTHRITTIFGGATKAFLAKPVVICMALQLVGRESYTQEILNFLLQVY
jgi:hypothetical protein